MYEATRQATANVSRLFTARYLLNVLLALVLIEFISPPLIDFLHLNRQHYQCRHQVSAARVKGLIYNKDGKFIYRPSRSNQAHIIVIDDRSPSRTARNNKDTVEPSGRLDNNKTTASLEQAGSPLGAASSFASHNYPMIQLYHPAAAAAAAAAAQLASANSIRAMYAPATATVGSPASPFGPLANYELPAPGGQLAELQAVGGRLLQAQAARLHHQQMVPPPLQYVTAPRVTNPQVVNPIDAYGYSHAYQEYPSAEQYQSQSRVSGGQLYEGIHQPTAATYHSMPVIEQRQLPYGADDPREQQHHLHQAQDMAPFDEQSPTPPSGGYSTSSSLRNQPPPSRLYGKFRRASSSSAVIGANSQDLDDAEGDHVDYYDAELRDQGQMASHERGSHRQYVRPPFHSSMMDGERGAVQVSSRSASGGSPYHHNDHGHTSRASIEENQTPIPGSIQSIKSLLKRPTGFSEPNGVPSSKIRSKQQLGASGPGGPSGDGGGQVPPKAINLTAPPHDHGMSMAGADHANGGAQGREPKGMQYWKQYQDQFDIVK